MCFNCLWCRAYQLFAVQHSPRCQRDCWARCCSHLAPRGSGVAVRWLGSWLDFRGGLIPGCRLFVCCTWPSTGPSNPCSHLNYIQVASFHVPISFRSVALTPQAAGTWLRPSDSSRAGKGLPAPPAALWRLSSAPASSLLLEVAVSRSTEPSVPTPATASAGCLVVHGSNPSLIIFFFASLLIK